MHRHVADPSKPQEDRRAARSLFRQTSLLRKSIDAVFVSHRFKTFYSYKLIYIAGIR